MKIFFKQISVCLFLFIIFKQASFMDNQMDIEAEKVNRKHSRTLDHDPRKRFRFIQRNSQNRFNVRETGILDLSNLNINNNQFIEILNSTEKEYVEYLDLSNNSQIDHIGLQHLASCPNLIGINFACCGQLKFIDIKTLSNCPKLKIINIYTTNQSIYQSLNKLKETLPYLEITNFYMRNFFYSINT